MRIRYFSRTDTLFIEFRDAPVAETISTKTRCWTSTLKAISARSQSSMHPNAQIFCSSPTSKSRPDPVAQVPGFALRALPLKSRVSLCGLYPGYGYLLRRRLFRHPAREPARGGKKLFRHADEDD